MTAVNVNYLAIFVCAVLNMGLGFLWFGPLFGKKWMHLSGIGKQQIEEFKKSGKNEMNKTYLIAFAGALVMAFVLSYSVIFSGYYFDMTGVQLGLMTGFFNWLGFIAPVLLASVLWERKSWNLYVLNAGYYLVLLLMNSVILASWM